MWYAVAGELMNSLTSASNLASLLVLILVDGTSCLSQTGIDYLLSFSPNSVQSSPVDFSF